ncbi:unnamed protein product, partial [Darwinula stevensoni]
MLNKEDFNNDAKDGGELGLGHQMTAIYEIGTTASAADGILSVDPLKYQSNSKKDKNLGNPSGGKKDEKPPVMDSLRSVAGRQVKFKPRELVFYFDEFIEVKDATKQVLVSPPLTYIPKIKAKGKRLSFIFDEKEVLKDDATYTINFGDAIVDYHEGNKLSNFTYVFSTGLFLDSLNVAGKIINAQSHKGEGEMIVFLYDKTADTIVKKEKPFYFAKPDKDGFIQPTEGHVYLNDEEVTRDAMYRRAQKGVGYLPQEPSVFRKLSVEDNIKAVLEMTELSKAEQKDKLESLISEFRLDKVRKNSGDSLSGGERRRTEIARSLASSPKFILLDEPFAGIDPIAVEDIQYIVAKLKTKNIGILITDHNVQETLSITDRAYLMFEGNILKAGTAEELAEDE